MHDTQPPVARRFRCFVSLPLATVLSLHSWPSDAIERLSASGLDLGAHQPHRRSLHRLLPVRVRRLARRTTRFRPIGRAGAASTSFRNATTEILRARPRGGRRRPRRRQRRRSATTTRAAWTRPAIERKRRQRRSTARSEEHRRAARAADGCRSSSPSSTRSARARSSASAPKADFKDASMLIAGGGQGGLGSARSRLLLPGRRAVGRHPQAIRRARREDADARRRSRRRRPPAARRRGDALRNRRWPRRRSTRVARRDPANDLPQDDARRAPGADAALRLGALLRRRSARRRFTRHQRLGAGLLQGVQPG